MRKGDVQAGGEDEIVVFSAYGRIRDVDVAKLILPSQPLVQLRHRPEVKGKAVLASLLQVGKQACTLGDHGALGQLLVEFLTQGEGGESVGVDVRTQIRS